MAGLVALIHSHAGALAATLDVIGWFATTASKYSVDFAGLALAPNFGGTFLTPKF